MFTLPSPPATITPENLLAWIDEGFRGIDQAFKKLGKRQYYAPTWKSTGTQPAIGNGNVIGAFVELGTALLVSARITVGSTTTFGTGTWFLTLPRPMAKLAPGFAGHGIAYDASAAFGYSITPLVLTPTESGVNDSMHLQGDGGNLSGTFPFTWANSDTLWATIFYPTE